MNGAAMNQKTFCRGLQEEGDAGLNIRPGAPRWFDFLAAAGGLLALSPLLAAIAAAIRLSDGGRVFYRHKRVGRGFRPIEVWKFQTMVEGADKTGPGITTADDPRVTPIGRLLRKHKLDELPQLINVIRGEMALVGPRPETPEYVNQFPREYKILLRVRPGITDPASLAFANEEELLTGGDSQEFYVNGILPRKLRLSLEYLGRRTWKTDFRILWHTFGRVIGACPARASGHRPAQRQGPEEPKSRALSAEETAPIPR